MNNEINVRRPRGAGFAREFTTSETIERLRFTFAPNGKRQNEVENFSESEISRSKLSRTILMNKTGVKTSYLLVEVINS